MGCVWPCLPTGFVQLRVCSASAHPVCVCQPRDRVCCRDGPPASGVHRLRCAGCSSPVGGVLVHGLLRCGGQLYRRRLHLRVLHAHFVLLGLARDQEHRALHNSWHRWLMVVCGQPPEARDGGREACDDNVPRVHLLGLPRRGCAQGHARHD